ncbi:hypothetical protein LZ906_017360 (plasmid) [Paraclostridium ghonii]|nr:hypothetical protein [Paeniclostridium ghonii]
MSKNKNKGWKDINEVVKVAIVPAKKKSLVELMVEIPKGNGRS